MKGMSAAARAAESRSSSGPAPCSTTASGDADAVVVAERAAGHPEEFGMGVWALPALIEATARNEKPERRRTRDPLYRKAIDHLGRTRARFDLARAHLVYGEWLRRQKRRLDAREHLRIADELFAAMGFDAFAERSAREVRAADGNATVPSRHAATDLTPQEAQIALLARDGLSNADIGSRLFISPRTVEYHLRKVYTKLGVASRTSLPQIL